MTSVKDPIIKITAREILDSRGNPTVEAEVLTKKVKVCSAAPSGASTGMHEAIELRDGGKRFFGKGVLKAVANVNGPIAKKLRGMDVSNFVKVDRELIALDGTRNKSRLGANATTAVSMALAKASAAARGKPVYRLFDSRACLLPAPLMNIVNGGKHASNELAIQEFMIVPTGFSSFKEALRAGCEVYQILGKKLKEGLGASARNVGDEGGFAPNLKSSRDALDFIVKAIGAAGLEDEVFIAIDAAATSFYNERSGAYMIDGLSLDRDSLLEHYESLCSDYPIVSIEDPFHEEDFRGFAEMTSKIGKEVQVVGDDLLVTNTERLREAISASSVTALLLKINQIGSVSEALEASELAFKSNLAVVVSHRSGETEDPFIADFAVGIGAGQIKTGAPARAERTCKYNRLLRIEEDLGSRARFAGRKFRTAGANARRR